MTKVIIRPSEDIYIELVQRLFSTLLPAMIMVVSFAAVGALLAERTGDRFLSALALLGCLAGVARIVVLLRYRAKAGDATLTIKQAQKIERHYAFAYFVFAGLFGGFAARAFAIASPEAHVLLAELLFGYGAGVATGVSLRPWIALPSVLVATVPSIVTSLALDDVHYRTAGILLTIFLLGGMETMLSRYRSAIKSIGMRRLFSTMARHDALTGLANRLLLRERFEECSGKRDWNMLAVHCLDLDHFKPVNDQHGHPRGDQLLKAVAGRLQASLRNGDLAARTGGDEFVVLQTDIQSADEAEMLARRIVRAVSQPYALEGCDIRIGVSIGFTVSSMRGVDLDQLIGAADQALYRAKRHSGGVVRSSENPVQIESRRQFFGSTGTAP